MNARRCTTRSSFRSFSASNSNLAEPVLDGREHKRRHRRIGEVLGRHLSGIGQEHVQPDGALQIVCLPENVRLQRLEDGHVERVMGTRRVERHLQQPPFERVVIVSKRYLFASLGDVHELVVEQVTDVRVELPEGGVLQGSQTSLIVGSIGSSRSARRSQIMVSSCAFAREVFDAGPVAIDALWRRARTHRSRRRWPFRRSHLPSDLVFQVPDCVGPPKLMMQPSPSAGETMADLASVRAEIDRACKLVDLQRRDILALRRAGVSIADAELVLARQLAYLDGLIGERNRLMARSQAR